MALYKRCPRCGGSLYHDRDIYGAYVACLHCGHELTKEEMQALRRAVLPKLGYIGTREPELAAYQRAAG